MVIKLHFYDKEIPKVDFYHTFLTLISSDSALRKDENYYPQVFLEQCKYIKKKVTEHITQDT